MSICAGQNHSLPPLKADLQIATVKRERKETASEGGNDVAGTFSRDLSQDPVWGLSWRASGFPCEGWTQLALGHSLPRGSSWGLAVSRILADD